MGRGAKTTGGARILALDGYNVLHRDARLRAHFQQGLAAARTALIRFCGDWIASRGDAHQFWIVFDGADCGALGAERGAAGVRVLYSAAGQSADDRLIELVAELRRYSACTVVSDDREVARRAKALGADILSVAEFRRIPQGRGAGRRAAQGQAMDDAAEKTMPEHERQALFAALLNAWEKGGDQDTRER